MTRESTTIWGVHESDFRTVGKDLDLSDEVIEQMINKAYAAFDPGMGSYDLAEKFINDNLSDGTSAIELNGHVVFYEDNVVNYASARQALLHIFQKESCEFRGFITPSEGNTARIQGVLKSKKGEDVTMKTLLAIEKDYNIGFDAKIDFVKLGTEVKSV